MLKTAEVSTAIPESRRTVWAVRSFRFLVRYVRSKKRLRLLVVLGSPMLADVIQVDRELGGIQWSPFAEVFTGCDDLEPRFELRHTCCPLLKRALSCCFGLSLRAPSSVRRIFLSESKLSTHRSIRSRILAPVRWKPSCRATETASCVWSVTP